MKALLELYLFSIVVGSCGDYGGLGWPWSFFSLGSLLQSLFLFAFTYLQGSLCPYVLLVSREGIYLSALGLFLGHM